MKRGVVLSGKGTEGAASIGALMALQELGVPVDGVSACGSAMLPAVMYCAGRGDENNVRLCLDAAYGLFQKKSVFRRRRRGYRLLRQELDGRNALHIGDLRTPCALVWMEQDGERARIVAPLPAMESPELSVSPDGDLAHVIHRDLWESRKKNLPIDVPAGRLIWPLMQMGVDRILLVEIGGEERTPKRMETYRPNVLHIEVPPPETTCVQDWWKAGYQAILSRPMDVYDWAFFSSAGT